MRVRLDLAYDGTAFAGWARQLGQRTVQEVVTDALSSVFRESIKLIVAGRTDSGVHATGQVAHCDVSDEMWQEQGSHLIRRAAAVLPPDVRLFGASRAHPDFHARFAALRRHYRYRVTDRRGGACPLRRYDTVAWRRPLSLPLLRQASETLCGEHDFAAYCRRKEGATTIRRLERLLWCPAENEEYVYEAWVTADAFCHSMVRSLVGALLAVGEGNRPPEWPATLLTRTERASTVDVAPPHGLTLVGVDYPPDDQLAARADRTRALRTLS